MKGCYYLKAYNKCQLTDLLCERNTCKNYSLCDTECEHRHPEIGCMVCEVPNARCSLRNNNEIPH